MTVTPGAAGQIPPEGGCNPSSAGNVVEQRRPSGESCPSRGYAPLTSGPRRGRSLPIGVPTAATMLAAATLIVVSAWQPSSDDSAPALGCPTPSAVAATALATIVPVASGQGQVLPGEQGAAAGCA